MSPRDPRALPPDLPVPGDDGAADHLEGMRIPLIADDGVIAKVFYGVFPPDRNPIDVIDWLSARA